MKYVVAFYAVDRAYGGPEEGGWWFDTGELVRLHRVCLTEAAAARLAVRANLRGGKGRAISVTGKLKALAVAALPSAARVPPHS